MKFKSPIFTQVSGSLGGATYAHNQGGLYVRARSIPVNSNTAAQQAVRNALTSLQSAWSNSLTNAQRDAWDDYASNVPLVDALGDSRLVTGQAHYLRSNVPRIRAGLARVDDGPTTMSLPELGTVSITSSAGSPGLNLSVTYDDTLDWCDEDGAAMIIQSSADVAATINFFAGPFRYSDKIDGDSVSAPTSPTSVQDVFASTAANRRYARIRLSRADGRLSAPQIVTDVIS